MATLLWPSMVTSAGLPGPTASGFTASGLALVKLAPATIRYELLLCSAARLIPAIANALVGLLAVLGPLVGVGTGAAGAGIDCNGGGVGATGTYAIFAPNRRLPTQLPKAVM